MTSQDNINREISGQTLADVAGTVIGIGGGTFAGVLVLNIGVALGGHFAGIAVCAGTAGLSGVAIYGMMTKNENFKKLILISMVVVTLLTICRCSMSQPQYSQNMTDHYSFVYSQQGFYPPHAQQVPWVTGHEKSLEDITGSWHPSSKIGHIIQNIVNKTFLEVENNTSQKTYKVVGLFSEKCFAVGLVAQRQWYLYDEITPLTLP